MYQPENPWSLDRGMNGVMFKLIVFYRNDIKYLTIKQQVKHLSKQLHNTCRIIDNGIVINYEYGGVTQVPYYSCNQCGDIYCFRDMVKELKGESYYE